MYTTTWKSRVILALVVSIIGLLILPSVVLAQVPPGEETITVKKSDLPPDILAKIQAQKNIETYGKWAGLGREVGLAINEGLQALTKTADEFSKTDVGRFTMFLIAWKIIGTDALQIVFGTIFFLFGSILFLWSWWINGRTRKIAVGLDEKGKKKYEVAKPSEAVQIGHAIWLIAFFFFIVVVVFV